MRAIKERSIATKISATQVGSPPRAQDVVYFIFAREREAPYDTDAFDAAMTAHVDRVVGEQVKAGICNWIVPI